MDTPRRLTPPLSVAPMMDYTDRHFRVFLRCITRHTLLYTEMVHTNALLLGDKAQAFEDAAREGEVVLQLGGDDPASLARCAALAEALGFAEVNLNVGCPSPRVQSGNFGACLMAEPRRVAESVAAMRASSRLPITVKHRIGIDDQDRYEDLLAFVDTIAPSGCDRFVVHARKAWLSGLSPKENRSVPPLRYDEVYRLKAERPALQVEINGGIKTLDEAATHLSQVDGVMIGRAAVEDPYLFAEADGRFFGDGTPTPSRVEVARRYLQHVEAHLAAGGTLPGATKPLLGLFNGQPGARAWRRLIGGEAARPRADVESLRAALEGFAPEA